MQTKYFHSFVTQSCLFPKEKAEAWRLYKEQSPDDAVLFVRKIEESMAAHRRNRHLRSTPVSYKVWGERFIEEGALKQMAAAARLPRNSGSGRPSRRPRLE
ncbi:MAG: hypothetical protein LLG04_14220, partial [Parachlamydia sp.]|nr:hypothetical protein [Parachlamydia sp.]